MHLSLKKLAYSKKSPYICITKETNNKLFDIHCHVFNLSHAGIIAFLNRFFLNNALSLDDLINGRFQKIIKHIVFGKDSVASNIKKIIFSVVLIVIVVGEIRLIEIALVALNLAPSNLTKFWSMIFYSSRVIAFFLNSWSTLC